ncbi:MAG: hypothetical protein BV459_00360 [Thermoplasmata archaeon M11B2D]|nr:MAG: hypothetical protein BV459_00360 [Thermoplasmata archaeon M11B2D]
MSIDNNHDKILCEVFDIDQTNEDHAQPISGEIIEANQDTRERESARVPARTGDSQMSADLDEDYRQSRETIRATISRAGDALEDILEIAKLSQHPRAYEVANQLIKNISDMSKDLLEVHARTEKIKKDKEPEQGKNPQTVNNNLFVGSTADLQKMLKQLKDGGE